MSITPYNPKLRGGEDKLELAYDAGTGKWHPSY